MPSFQTHTAVSRRFQSSNREKFPTSDSKRARKRRKKQETGRRQERDRESKKWRRGEKAPCRPAAASRGGSSWAVASGRCGGGWRRKCSLAAPYASAARRSTRSPAATAGTTARFRCSRAARSAIAVGTTGPHRRCARLPPPSTSRSRWCCCRRRRTDSSMPGGSRSRRRRSRHRRAQFRPQVQGRRSCRRRRRRRHRDRSDAP